MTASKLTIGDKLLSPNKNEFVQDVSYDKNRIKVFNLSVKANHNYFVGESGVLVHNIGSNNIFCKILDSSGNISRSIAISAKRLQKKWKHAKDFGVSGNFNKANAERYRKAIDDHVKNTNTVPIPGEYTRGNIQVVHYLDKTTGVNVMKDLDGNFVSGWKLSTEQLNNVLKTGKLGGG